MALAEPVVEPLLYAQVAARIRDLVDKRTLRPGQRIPSVREYSRQAKVSISTVVQAYRLLEDQGIIEARPKSGYYVRAKPLVLAPEPAISNPRATPTKVAMGELVMRFLRASSVPGAINLGAAVPEPDLLPLKQALRSLGSATRRYGNKTAAYEFPPGSRQLREQLARRSIAAGCSLGPDELVVTTGCQEALHLALRAVAKPGDTVAIESPTFYGTLQLIEALGMRAVEIPTHPRDGMSVDALQFAIESHRIAAVITVANFNNPLGSCMPDAAKRELVKLLAQREIPLIEDDLYGDLSFAPERPKALKAWDKKGLVLYCSSFSKTVAPGFRVGWLAAGRFQSAVEHLKFVTSLASSTPSQLALADFLANGGYDHYLRGIRTVYRDQVAEFSRAVTRFFPDGTRISRPQGGFLLWVELPERVDALDLHARALDAGISIAPGPIFSAKRRYGNHIRLNCGRRYDENAERALIRLGQLAS